MLPTFRPYLEEVVEEGGGGGGGEEREMWPQQA